MSEQKTKQIDQDGLWKNITTYFIKDFVQLFLPKFYPKVDFSRGVEYLEQEFQQIIRTVGKDGKTYKDKLVKVFLYNGTEQWILIHIEIQSYRDPKLPERMFVYYRRIKDKYNCEVIALAVYTHYDVPASYNHYYHEFEGTEISYKFNARLVKNYPKAELLASKNPLALAVLAAQYLNETKEDERRLEFKKKISSMLVERGYSDKEINQLLIFIKFLLKLPIALEENFKSFINNELDMNKGQTWVDYYEILNEEYHGISMKDLKAAKERSEDKTKEERAKRKESEAKRRENITQITIKLLKKGLLAEEVAKIVSIPLAKVKKIQASLK